MCGILGFNWEDSEFLRNGLKAIAHRGPDSHGKYTDKGISLGHRRLSIIDLSNSGKQPMSNESQDIWIVFNGEIYNYKKLRELLEKNHSFKSNTDTEVIIHLYEEKGLDFVQFLEGIFALCIYDSKKKLLILARDKAGIKPLYYYKKDKKFAFSSEIKGILEDKKIKREVNYSCLESYFIFRANTSNETFFKDIYKLPAGNLLIYGLKDNSGKIKKYWDLHPQTINKNFSYYSEKLKSLLEDSVRSQLMSDVPYGVYLSGGVDSGTLAAFMKKHASKLMSFSVGFEEKEHSEAKQSEFLADYFGFKHHELTIKQDSIKALPAIVKQSDEPVADPTCIPVYLLSKYTKKYCTVVLTGEGSDELFAGYPQYKFMQLHSMFAKKFPKFVRKASGKSLNLIPGKILNKGFKFASALGEKGRERFSNFVESDSEAEQYLQQVSIFNNEEQSVLYNNKNNFYRKYEKKYFNGNQDVVTSCQKLDFKESMAEDLLMKLDKNTMAFGVEGRVPFLDSRIIELAFQMPVKYKLPLFGQNKSILRSAVKGIVPEETRKRKKAHFFVPIDSWLSNELTSLKEELLSKDFIQKQRIFNYLHIQKMHRNFASSKLYCARQFWSLLIFQIWYKTFIKNEKIKI